MPTMFNIGQQTELRIYGTWHWSATGTTPHFIMMAGNYSHAVVDNLISRAIGKCSHRL